MENNANLSDGARQADTVSSEHAETMFSADQAETNMVKLVDGKLVSTGHTESDVSEDMPRIRLGSDEERALVGDEKKKYENSEAALRAGNVLSIEAMPNDPIAVGNITGNPDAGSTVNTGLPSEDEPNNTTQQSDDATATSSFTVTNMIPQTPGIPDPTQPVPGIPETPPYNPIPGPEMPEFPGTPSPGVPEIQEPDQPQRSHEVNDRQPKARHHTASANFLTETASVSGLIDENDVAPSVDSPGEAVPGTQYQGLAAGPDDEGMEDKPDTGNAARPYDVNAKDTTDYQPGERPEEAKETRALPRELMDESSIAAQDMISGPDRSDQKSTDGLDRTYNDPQAARDMAS